MSSIQKVVLPNNKEMQHGRIVELRAQFGDWVDKGQEVMRLQIHERTLAFTAPQAGILASTVPIGHQPEPGSLLFSLKPQDEISHYKIKKVTLTNSKEMLHGRIVELRVQAGDSVTKDQDILVVQINARTLVFTSPQAGIVESIASMGHQPEPGSLLFSLRISEEQSNSKKSESANEKVSNKKTAPPSESEEPKNLKPSETTSEKVRHRKPPPSTREGPTDIKKPKPSNEEASSAGIVILAVGIVSLASFWWFYWHNQNVVVMNCKVSEYVDIRHDRQGKIVNQFYDHRLQDHSLLTDRRYEISVDSTGLPSLRLLESDDTLFDWADKKILCKSTAKNCEGTLTNQGATFINTGDFSRTKPPLDAPQESGLSYEFNYDEKTLYTTVSSRKEWGTFHIFYRCSDNSSKNI